MEKALFGCEALPETTLAAINGGGYVANMIVLVKGAYALTKGFVATAPLVGPLATSLLSSFVDPVVDAA
ncbi:hypothetical protein ACWKWU_02150 [Chitinophaga lutea]